MQASDPRQASHLAMRGLNSGKPSQAFLHLGASPEASNGRHIEPSDAIEFLQGWWCERRSSPLPRPAREPSSVIRPPQLRDEGVTAERFRLMPVVLIKLCIEAQI
jgi:hypothetical protein